jgi:hypothetical protein
LAGNDLKVEVKNLETGVSLSDITGLTAEDLQYTVLFEYIENGRAAAVGDKFSITVTGPQGVVLRETEYTLTLEDIQGGRVTVDVTLPYRFTMDLAEGLNLISVPLASDEPWTLRDLTEHIGTENVDMIIYLKDNKLIGYAPDSPEDTSADVPVMSDEAYIVVMKSPTSVTFIGEACDSEVSLSKELDTMSLPVNPGSWLLSDLANYIGPNLSSIIWYDRTVGRFVRYNPAEPEIGDTIICGGQGYIVSMTEPTVVTFEGWPWVNPPATVASPPVPIARNFTTTPLLAIEGTVLREDTGQALNGIKVTVNNLSTGMSVTTDIGSTAGNGQYLNILADLTGNRAAQVGDILEVKALDSTGVFGVEPIRYIVTPEDVKASKISLSDLLLSPIPKESALLANYPNPFNPETWIPFKLSSTADVTVRIYNVKGQLVRTLNLGDKAAGTYVNRRKAAYWDGKNEHGEAVASGVYFYSIQAGKFSATRRMAMVK